MFQGEGHRSEVTVTGRKWCWSGRSDLARGLFMAVLRSRCGHYIFILWFLLSIFLLRLFFLA